MKQKVKFGIGIFVCGTLALAGFSAAFETGKMINLTLAIVFLLLAIALILKWPGRKQKRRTDFGTREDQLQPPIRTAIDISLNDTVTEENATAKGAPFSYLDARALKFWDQKTTDYQIPSYYSSSAFGRNAKPVLNRLLSGKYLEIGEIKKSIEQKKVPEIKEILAAHGLKVSGKKAELVQRLMDNISKTELESLFPVRIYEITDKGKAALKYYSIVFISEKHNLSLSFYRLLREKESHPNLPDEEILLQILIKDMDKASENGEQESYRVAAERTARFLEETGNIKQAFSVYCSSFFMFWYRNTVKLGVNGPPEAYGYPAKSIERCGQLCGYSLQETLKQFQGSLQKINPFGLATNRNIDSAIKTFRDALSL